jgi:hypothetical protein
MRTPWYHDFSELGIHTPQRDGIYSANQPPKVQVLFPYIRRAVDLCEAAGSCHGVELFCADGLYAHFALKCGAQSMLGVDLGLERGGGLPVHLEQATQIGKLLGHGERATFKAQDVHDVTGTYDLVICAGGLYHLRDPAAYLNRLRDMTRTALVLQSAVTLENEDPGYVESPIPERLHGSRFSFAWLQRSLRDAGFEVLMADRNELVGNPHPNDRGSAYFLCR